VRRRAHLGEQSLGLDRQPPAARLVTAEPGQLGALEEALA